MSRVSYVMMNPGAETELTRVIRECVDGLVAELCRGGGRTDRMLELTIVGDPSSHHLALRD